MKSLFENQATFGWNLPKPRESLRNDCEGRYRWVSLEQHFSIPDELWDRILSLLPVDKEKMAIAGYRARRWVVERTHSWVNLFRPLLDRWEKKQENYTARLHFACAWISFRSAEAFGI